MLVIYLAIIVAGMFYLTLLLMVFIRAAQEKRMAKVFETPGIPITSTTERYADILRSAWRRLKNSRDRVAVLALSEAIQKLTRGEHVKQHVIIYILSRLDGAGDVIEEIKGVRA